MNVEVDDSTPNAGRLVPVPMAGAACATANGRPRAVLSPGPRPRTDLRLQVSCTNTIPVGSEQKCRGPTDRVSVRALHSDSTEVAVSLELARYLFEGPEGLKQYTRTHNRQSRAAVTHGIQVTLP